ncbi:MAG: Crp/Fnr family transcriptional regulator [Magnetococcales bacterium]|nr:Crp/Fnr family transcriptional regulator [Magnetococcales bacterium]MBF0322325.1 Crp/Fnr family transcriptional regulator [Magnetococcales bacterium]
MDNTEKPGESNRGRKGINPLEQVRSNPLFSSLSQEAWEGLLPHMATLRLSPGQAVFYQGDPFRGFFVLLRGSVKLFRLAVDGQEKVIELIRSGQTFAEAILFSRGALYPVSAEATEESRLLHIAAAPYRKILEDSPELCLNLLSGMSQKLHQLVLEIDRLTLQHARERLLSYLLQEAGSQGLGENIVHLRMTRKILASRLSVQPETLSRLFKMLKQEGLVEESGKTLRIVDMETMRRALE